MSLHTRLQALERKVAARRLDALPVFFDSEEECEVARSRGKVSENAICIIEDYKDED